MEVYNFYLKLRWFYFCRFFSDEIIERIHEAGFRIAARKETTLSRDVAEEFYADHSYSV
jgi:nucleoside diphosphate kinase